MRSKGRGWLTILTLMLLAVLLLSFFLYRKAETVTQSINGFIISGLALLLALLIALDCLVFGYVGDWISTELSSFGCVPKSILFLISLVGIGYELTIPSPITQS